MESTIWRSTETQGYNVPEIVLSKKVTHLPVGLQKGHGTAAGSPGAENLLHPTIKINQIMVTKLGH